MQVLSNRFAEATDLLMQVVSAKAAVAEAKAAAPGELQGRWLLTNPCIALLCVDAVCKEG
jgi:hypothetical protein